MAPKVEENESEPFEHERTIVLTDIEKGGGGNEKQHTRGESLSVQLAHLFL